MALTQDRRAKIGIGGRRMKNENPRHGGNVAGAGDSNEQTYFTTPPQDDQQNDSPLHVAPTCAPGDASARLVAVNLYCKEADALAPPILPATPAVLGHRWFYVVRGKAPTESFLDPVFGGTVLEIRDATSEFANIRAAEIGTDKLCKAVARLAAHCLGKRYCEGVLEADDESLVQSLDTVDDATVTERIVVWLDYPPADA
jgi:hypothetical protein